MSLKSGNRNLRGKSMRPNRRTGFLGGLRERFSGCKFSGFLKLPEECLKIGKTG
jgi:hypothetical protein